MSKKKHIIVSPYSAFQGPRAPITYIERQWLRDVINEKKVIKKPVEKPIEIPKEYLSYWESSAERKVKWLSNQHEFLSARLKGLAGAIFGYSKCGQNPPKELLNAHKNYLKAVSYIEDQRDAFQYALDDAGTTKLILEAVNNA